MPFIESWINLPAEENKGWNARWNAWMHRLVLKLNDSKAIKTYTPILTATGVNPTLGSGSISLGWYQQDGPKVTAWWFIRFGTAGAAAGTGFYKVTGPTPAVPGIPGISFGTGRQIDNSAVIERAASLLLDGNTGAGGVSNWYQQTIVTSQFTTDATPWVWAAQDIMGGTMTYFTSVP